MLRWVIALLLAANVGYFLWTQGHLAAWGLAPTEQAEPERLGTQIAPESLRLLNTPRTGEPATEPAASPEADRPEEAPPSAPGPAQAPPVASPVSLSIPAPGPAPEAGMSAPAVSCWVVSGLTEAQLAGWRNVLTRLDFPAGSWQISESRSGGRWIVYMGRFDSAEAMERKKAELRALQIPYRAISTPGLAPGLALGTYSTEAAAQQALRDAMRAGVRTARVAQERAESRSFALRLPAATSAQRAAVAGLGPSVPEQALEPCP